jgi:hypothetical protein
MQSALETFPQTSEPSLGSLTSSAPGLRPSYTLQFDIPTGAIYPHRLETDGDTLHIASARPGGAYGAMKRAEVSLTTGEHQAVSVPDHDHQIVMSGGQIVSFEFSKVFLRVGDDVSPALDVKRSVTANPIIVAPNEILFREGDELKRLRISDDHTFVVESPLVGGGPSGDASYYFGMARDGSILIAGHSSGGTKWAQLQRDEHGDYRTAAEGLAVQFFLPKDILSDGRLAGVLEASVGVSAIGSDKLDWEHTFIRQPGDEPTAWNIYSFAAAPGGGFVCGHRNGALSIGRPDANGNGFSIESFDAFSSTVVSVALLRDGRIVGTDTTGKVKIWQ